MGRKLPVFERITIKGTKENCDAFSKHPHRLALLRGEVPHTDDPELLRKRAEWAEKKAARREKVAEWTVREAAMKPNSEKGAFLPDSDTEDSLEMASKFI